MKCLFLFLLLLGFYPTSGQETDTTILEKKGKPQHFYPRWKAGSPADTFLMTDYDFEVNGNDSIWHRRFQYRFVHRVDSITEKGIFQTAWIGREYCNAMIYTQKCPQVLLEQPFFRFTYLTPHSGKADSIVALNCMELLETIWPLYRLKLGCEKQFEADSNGVAHRLYRVVSINDLPACQSISQLAKAPILRFHQFYGALVPKKGLLRYQTTKRMKGVGWRLSQIVQVELDKKKNGLQCFYIQERMNDISPAFVEFVKIMGSNPDLPDPNDTGLPLPETKFIFTKENYPVFFMHRSDVTIKGVRKVSDLRFRRIE